MVLSVLCDVFLFCFIPFQFLQGTRSHASVDETLGFSALSDLPELFLKKTSKKRTIFTFLRFSAEKHGFDAVPSWGKVVFEP